MKPSKFKIFKYFYPRILPHLRIVFANLAVLAMVSILGMISPLIFREIFDDVFPTKNMKLFVILLVVGFVVETVLAVLTALSGYIQKYISQKVQHDLRSHIFTRFEDQKMEYYPSLSMGDHLWRLTNDVTKVQDMVAMNIPNLIQTTMELLLLLGLSLWIDWKLCLAALTIVPFFFFNGFLSFKRFKFFDKSSQALESEVNGFLRENITGIEEVKINNAEDRERVKYLRKISNKIRLESKGNAFYLGFTFLNQQFTKVWSWGITCFAGWHVISDTISLGDYVAVTSYLLRIFGPLNAYTTRYQEIVWQLVSGERLFHFLDLKGEKDGEATPNYVPDAKIAGDIRFKDVTFRYKDYGSDVLRKLDLTIPRGQKVALVGPVGCGKTTITRLLLKFYKPNAGTISIDGVDLEKIRPQDLREKVGVVFQRPVIFNDTILNNIRYGNKKATRQDVVNVLKLIDVYDYFMEMDKGIDRIAGEDGSNLSGGQKQLVAIARAYVKNPEILIFDEATASLDTFMEMKVNNALRKLMEGKTVIMIAHRLSSIRNVDRILFMRDGKVIEDGSLEELLEKKGYYYQIHSQHYGHNEKLGEADDNPIPQNNGNGFQNIWNLGDGQARERFKGSLQWTRLHGTAGELEVDLKGRSGYCTKVCAGELPETYQSQVLNNLSFDIYVPENTIKNIKNFFLIHVISKNDASDWYEVDKRKLKVGWNYFVMGPSGKNGKYFKGVKKLFFDFNSDEVIEGPIYITNIKGDFKA